MQLASDMIGKLMTFQVNVFVVNDLIVKHAMTCTRVLLRKKKRKYAERILQIEQGTFTPLIFTTTGGMALECQMFHSRLAE